MHKEGKAVYYCPTHFREVHPEPTPELLTCDLCGRVLQYGCITCQMNQEAWDEFSDVVEEMEEDGREAVKPSRYPLPTELKKTVQEWYQGLKDGKDHYENPVEVGLTQNEMERLLGGINQQQEPGLIPTREQRLRKYYTLQELRDILNMGYEPWKKKKEDEEEALTEIIEENKKKRLERIKEAREARNRGKKVPETHDVKTGLRNFWVYIKFIPKKEQTELDDNIDMQTIVITNCYWQNMPLAELVVDKNKGKQSWKTYLDLFKEIQTVTNKWLELEILPFTQTAPFVENQTITIGGEYDIRKLGKGGHAVSPLDITVSFYPTESQDWLMGDNNLTWIQDPRAVYIRVENTSYKLQRVDTIGVLKHTIGNWNIYADLINTEKKNELKLVSRSFSDVVETGHDVGNLLMVVGAFEITKETREKEKHTLREWYNLGHVAFEYLNFENELIDNTNADGDYQLGTKTKLGELKLALERLKAIYEELTTQPQEINHHRFVVQSPSNADSGVWKVKDSQWWKATINSIIVKYWWDEIPRDKNESEVFKFLQRCIGGEGKEIEIWGKTPRPVTGGQLEINPIGKMWIIDEGKEKGLMTFEEWSSEGYLNDECYATVEEDDEGGETRESYSYVAYADTNVSDFHTIQGAFVRLWGLVELKTAIEESNPITSYH